MVFFAILVMLPAMKKRRGRKAKAIPVTPLAQALKDADLGYTDLARLVDTSAQNIERLAKGSRKMSIEWAKKLSPHVDKTPSELMFGEIKESERGEFDPTISGAVSTEAPYEAKLPGGMPEIDISAGLGPGGLSLPAVTEKGGVIYSADAVRGEIVLPGYLVNEFTRAASKFIHWFRVRGDSMEPTITGGDRVGVDTTDTAIGGGGVFAIRDWDGEIQVKRLRKSSPQSGKIEVVSDNPKQGNQTVSVEEITILGRVVARISRIG